MSGKMLIIALSVFLLFSFHDGCAIKASDMTKYCMTKTCVDYSNLLKANMNTSIDPCVDFYQYSCGKFLSTNSIPDDKTQITNLDALEKNMKKNLADLLSSNVTSNDDNWSKNAKNYYASCINLDRVNNYTEAYTLKLLNDEFGGWPLISGKSNPKSPLDILIRIIKTGLYDLVSISVQPNPKDPTRNIIKITQPSGVPYEYFLSNDYIQAYKTYLRTIVGYLNPNRTLFDKDIDDIFELDRIISQIRMTISDEKNSTINIEMTLGDLQEKIPNFPWIDFITNGMFLNISDIQVNQSELVSIDNWDYLVKMQTIYSNYSSNYSQILQNYLLAKFFMDKVNDNLPLKYVQAKLDFNKLTTGQNALPDRSLFCISKGETYLPSETGKVYVNKYFSQKAKNDALQMTTNILNEFKTMLQENTWMDATSKAKAIEKANNVKTDIGYPDYYDNVTFVKTKFNYELDPNNLVKNILTSLEYAQRNIILGSLRSNEFRSFWIISATVLDANYNPSKNQIYVPAGNLNPPFYDKTLPNYLNYGAIGAVIGHEITHGFDDEGRRYDKNGRYYSDNEQGLWTQQTVDAFKNNTICIINEYNGYNVTEINQNVNGAQTLGENIADNGGIKSAYRAYQKWAQKNIFKPDLPLYGINLSPNQLFFVSMAQYWCTKSKPENLLNLVLSDPHSPPEFRVKGMTQNSRYFQKAFNCNNPSQMCSIW